VTADKPDTSRTALDALGRAPRGRRVRLSAAMAAAAVASAILRRSLDIVVAFALTVLTLPVVLAIGAVAAVRGRPALAHDAYLGRLMTPLALGHLEGAGPFARVPWLWAVLRGDLSLVGPAPLPAASRTALTTADLPRFQTRPGLAHLFRLREAANIAYEGRTAADLEQLHRASAGRDLGILLRSIPAAILGGRASAPPPVLDLLDVEIDNWTMEQAVDWLVSARREGRARQLAFVNPDCLNHAFTRPSYRAALDGADVVLPDGIGIHYACRLTGTALAANVNGTDLFPRLCEALGRTGQSVYFLGAKREVVEALAARTRETWPGLAVAGFADGYFPRGGAEERAVVDAINASNADVLLVAFGAPAQDEWIGAFRDRLAVRAALGVGGLFDFYSGRIARAPGWMRELGLEWVWRMLQEPGRLWKRYVIGNPLFLYRVWRWNHARLS
jgi:N-acetylglucosaminyldiphosphoundecaprenol N-acetyl-beta-D-mannosaminyltransferase